MIINRQLLSCAVAAAVLPFCANPLKPPAAVYHPQVVFVGTVMDEYDSLPGNREWPNTCTIKGDSVYMTFFSENFSETNHIRQGDFLRIMILPCSTAVNNTLSTRNIIFHMARFWDTNYSWEIVPRDTVAKMNSIFLHIQKFSLRHGAAIEFNEIGAIARAMTGTLGLTITDGRIFGSIE